MLQNIPTHVIAGPLGAGKTSLIRHLLSQRPAAERWAVLINEFGQIGLDAALLTRDEDGIALGEVAGGCLCCVNGAPFQVGLGRLLRKARPDRLFIEPSGLGHPAQLLKQLNEAPWKGVLAVQPCVLVLDAQALAAGKPLPRAQQDALSSAGLLVLNKDELLSDSDRLRVLEQLPDLPLFWTRHAAMPPCPWPSCRAWEPAPKWPWSSRTSPRAWPSCRPCGAIRRCRSASASPRRMAGASAGAGTPASSSIWSGSSTGCRTSTGAGPSWCSTVIKAGGRATGWIIHR